GHGCSGALLLKQSFELVWPVGIVRVLLRRLGLPRAPCERGYRPSDRGHRRQRPAHHPGDIAAPAILLDRGWGKAKELHARTAGRVSRSATAFISAFRAKFSLRINCPFSRKFVPGYEASTWFLLIRKQANRDVCEG